jgi:YHS domain-containing protein
VLYAEPRTREVNPFSPVLKQEIRLPVAIRGFCIVTLREQQEWVAGSSVQQLIFDGQIYWFQGQRERAIFAASPLRYVPVLAGDCVVTFATSGVRTAGDPQHGVLHNRRLFFFSSPEAQAEFQADPSKYENVDLANQGHCLVSRIDEGHQVAGLAETAVIVDGLRYHFASANHQQKFLAHMRHYGVTQPKARLVAAASPQPAVETTQPVPKVASESVQEKPAQSSPHSVEPSNCALSGYCPVSLQEQGIWIEGSPAHQVPYDGKTYLFASAEQQAKFAAAPDGFIPALGGNCVVTYADHQRLTPGSLYHAVYDEASGRFFFFAGPEQKIAFEKMREHYSQADLALEGHCVVTFVEEGKQVAGEEDLLVRHEGVRYLFASPEQREKFLKQPQRFRQP